MDLIFPRLVFKDGGKQERPGGSYSYLSVEDSEQYEEALTQGWYATLPDATEKKEVIAPVDNVAPTRAELEMKATELGIKFHPAIGDVNLLKKIDDALKD